MIKRLLFAAVVLASTAANATPTVSALFAAIRATGTQIYIDHPYECKDPTMMGSYTYARNQIDQFTVCVANHKGDSAELADTIRHEAVHVAQACKGGPLYSLSSIFNVSTQQERATVSTYPQHQRARELEARVIARDQDEVYVTNLIKEHCK